MELTFCLCLQFLDVCHETLKAPVDSLVVQGAVYLSALVTQADDRENASTLALFAHCSHSECDGGPCYSEASRVCPVTPVVDTGSHEVVRKAVAVKPEAVANRITHGGK